MFSWINRDEGRKHEPEVYASVAEGLRKLYQQVQVHYTVFSRLMHEISSVTVPVFFFKLVRFSVWFLNKTAVFVFSFFFW